MKSQNIYEKIDIETVAKEESKKVEKSLMKMIAKLEKKIQRLDEEVRILRSLK